ncbi:MAG TPA: SIMPL domain-containing protein [Thermodesulfobacteriota bacterium]|nr:SIMPL domain-containing protein [Thermodesulfobacteriota bacterium]
MISKTALLLSTVVLALAVSFPSRAQNVQYDKRTLTVNGKGETSAAPDVAYLNLAVETTAKSASQAVKDNAEKTNSVMEAIKAKLGENDKVSTAGYNLTPIHEYNNQTNKSEFKGYKASNQIVVEVHDLKQIGAIIDSTAEAGLNNIQGLRFDTTKSAELRKKALAEAVKDAQATARVLADAAGVKITRILQLSPSYDYPAPVYRDFAMAKEAAAPPTPIEPGDLTINATVNVVFEIE